MKLTTVFLDGTIADFEICETNCPFDCKENYWNCKGKCIPDTKPCGNFCLQGKHIYLKKIKSYPMKEI